MKRAARWTRKPAGDGGSRSAEKLAAYVADTPATVNTIEESIAGTLPDTCAWIDFFAGKPTSVADKLASALRGSDVFTCGPVLCELLQGARSSRDREALLSREIPLARRAPNGYKDTTHNARHTRRMRHGQRTRETEEEQQA